MSISSSLQQIAGGVAAAGGFIIVQKNKSSLLGHYDTFGWVIVVLTLISILMVYRVSKIVKAQQKPAPEMTKLATTVKG